MGVDTISTGNRFWGITLFRLSVGEAILPDISLPKGGKSRPWHHFA